jgi:hypothetical protein
MVASKGVSRATSVVSSGNARDVLKRRNKPYKTEQQKIIAKKRKLDIKVRPPSDPPQILRPRRWLVTQTTFGQNKPPFGYTFLALGTPDLAELCKELSRKRGLPVNVVNVCVIAGTATPCILTATPLTFVNRQTREASILEIQENFRITFIASDIIFAAKSLKMHARL